MIASCLLLTSWVSNRFWQEMYAFETLSCLLKTLNCKNFGKTLFFLQDIRKSRSKTVFLYLKIVSTSVLTSLTKSRPYLFFETPISGIEAGNFRSSRSLMFFKIYVLENFANLTGKHLCWSFFLIKMQVSRPATLLKRDSNTGVFLLNLRNFRTPFFAELLWWLLLKSYTSKKQEHLLTETSSLTQENCNISMDWLVKM